MDENSTEKTVSDMKIQMVKIEEKVNRHEYAIEELQKKQEVSLVEQTKTALYIEEIKKTLVNMEKSITSIEGNFSTKNDKSDDRWAKIVERAFWAIVTIVGYFVGKGDLGG